MNPGQHREYERVRIAFMTQRDGMAETIVWAKQLRTIYRQAVLNHHHFAGLPEYRWRFIESYCELKQWLRRVQ